MSGSERFLLVGSLLRPDELQTYNREIESRDDITYPFYDDLEGYAETEGKTVTEVVNKQIEAGIPEVTDGEFQRSIWHLDFVWGLDGVERSIGDSGWKFQNDTDGFEEGTFETRKDINVKVVAPLHSNNHTFIDHYKRVREEAGDHSVKLTIPSPAQIYNEFVRSMSDENGYSNDVYPTTDDLGEGLVQAWKEFVDEYTAVGGEVLQFDDCTWALFSKDNPIGYYTQDGATDETVKAQAEKLVSLNNAVVDYAHEKGLTVYTHNCRGNYGSRYAMGGSYEHVANYFLANQNYDRFYLEWDDDRAGNLVALEAFKDKPETEVVIGFLSSKKSGLADKEAVLAELEEAAKYIPKDKLYLSHQCGFASCDGGNDLTHEQQWNKIKQGQEIAQAFWGE
jgi:5-methyltetrahydropteroyltriglutamate--homocysteine methyltransferase